MGHPIPRSKGERVTWSYTPTSSGNIFCRIRNVYWIRVGGSVKYSRDLILWMMSHLRYIYQQNDVTEN